MKKIHAVLAAAVAGMSLVVAAVGHAQPYGGMGKGFGPGMGMGPGHGPMAGVDRSVIVDSHLNDLKASLNITATQEPAWQAFVAAAKQQAAGMQVMRSQMQSSGTLPERMAQRASMMQQRGAAMTTMTTAVSSLYAVLTAEQKAIADQGFGMSSHRGMRFGPRGS